MKIGIFSYRYPIETSVTIKGIASYIAEKNDQCTIFIDQFYGPTGPNLNEVTVHILKPQWLIQSASWYSQLKRIFSVRIMRIIFIFFDIFIKKIEEIILLPKVRDQLNQYDCVYAMEVHSLSLLFKSGFDLAKVVYFSLESDQIISLYDRRYVARLLEQCYSCVIQSKERGDDLKKKLNIEVNFQYLPVSLRPVKVMKNSRAETGQPLKIVYSGFFSEWSCLREFLTQVEYTDLLGKSKIALQGHAMGTEKYLAELISKFGKHENITINSEFINDSEFLRFLNDFDVGLAFYNGDEELANWKNLLYASGKIACYLWAGLGVMTNIDTEETKRAPFIFIEDFSSETIENRLHEYSKSSVDYQVAAIEFAQRYYNLDRFMDRIFADSRKVFSG